MIKIHCKEKWAKALTASRMNDDRSFSECVLRLNNWFCWDDVSEVNVFSDFGEHCFYFEVKRSDGSRKMNGGIIFHGFPSEGYKQNGSYQISPSYGWSIHT